MFMVPFQSYRLSRTEFNDMIAPLLNETIEQCRSLLDECGVIHDQLDRVLLVGGSTRIPAVRELLQQEFGRPVLRVSEPELAVCFGAATAGAHAVAERKRKQQEAEIEKERQKAKWKREAEEERARKAAERKRRETEARRKQSARDAASNPTSTPSAQPQVATPGPATTAPTQKSTQQSKPNQSNKIPLKAFLVLEGIIMFVIWGFGWLDGWSFGEIVVLGIAILVGAALFGLIE